jgi:hypothetical protein
MYLYIFFGATTPQWGRASSFARFLDHTQRRTTVGRTPLNECSARRRDLYLTTHESYNRQTSMLPAGFEPTISAGERPYTYALDRAASGTGMYLYICCYLFVLVILCVCLLVNYLSIPTNSKTISFAYQFKVSDSKLGISPDKTQTIYSHPLVPSYVLMEDISLCSVHWRR